MKIVIAGFDERDAINVARAKNYVARNFVGEGHVVTQDISDADVVVTQELLDAEVFEEEDGE